MATTTKRAGMFIRTSGQSRPATSGNKRVTGMKPQSSGAAQMGKVSGVIKGNLSGPFLGKSTAN